MRRDERDLHAALERALGAPVVALRRTPSAYRTSFALDELDVALADGRHLELVLKDVSRGALHATAQAAKPAFLYDPEREPSVYRDVLAGARLGTPRLQGAVAERRWLLLERVAGVELYQVGRRATWEHVARWLGRMHDRLRNASGAPCLIRYDAAFYARWPRRAIEFAHRRGDERALAVLEPIVARYDELVVERLLALEVTFLHGELYAANVLVDDAERPRRVAAVDWEQAAAGPGLVDLAALTSGGWRERDRAAIVAAYRAARAAGGAPEVGGADALEACRLHLAMQWLGWAPDWRPPAEHRHDWLGEAAAAARRLSEPGGAR